MSDRDRFAGLAQAWLQNEELTPLDRQFVIEYLLRYLRGKQIVINSLPDVLEWKFTGDNIVWSTIEMILQPGYLEIDYDWDNITPDMSISPITAISIDDDYIYAGGTWQSTDPEYYWPGGVSSGYVSRYDRTTGIWTGIGTDTEPGGSVYGMDIDSNGNLYCGGNNGLWKWDGSSWEELDGTHGFAPVVISGTDLYYGGQGGVTCPIKHYDLGTEDITTLGTADSGVWALALDSYGNLYAGGSYDNIDATPFGHVAMWNGATWSALGTGATSGSVRALCVDGSDQVYIGGTFTTPISRIMKWSNSTLSDIESGVDGSVWALLYDSYSGNVYVGGNFSTPAADLFQITGTFSKVGSGIELVSGGQIYDIKADSQGNLVIGADWEASYFEFYDTTLLLGFDAENTDYKSTDDRMSDDSDILYPSQSAVRDYSPMKKITTDAPTVNDDITEGYRVGDLWIDTDG